LLRNRLRRAKVHRLAIREHLCEEGAPCPKAYYLL
jgi:hypothetical protein